MGYPLLLRGWMRAFGWVVVVLTIWSFVAVVVIVMNSRQEISGISSKPLWFVTQLVAFVFVLGCLGALYNNRKLAAVGVVAGSLMIVLQLVMTIMSLLSHDPFHIPVITAFYLIFVIILHRETKRFDLTKKHPSVGPNLQGA